MMQKKPPEQKQPTQIEPSSLADTWVEQASDFFNRYSREIATVLGAIVLLVVLYFLFYHKSISSVQETLFDLQQKKSMLQLEEIKKDQASIEKTLKELQEILREDPNLTPMVQGEMTQAMLEIGQTKEAISQGDELLRRTSKEHLTLFQDFARTSLSIADKQLDLALKTNYQEITAFQDLNRKPTAEEESLWVWAIIRAAFLEDMLGHKDKSLALWKELMGLENGTFSTHAKAPSKEAVQQVMRNLDIGSVTFKNFIKAQVEPVSSP